MATAFHLCPAIRISGLLAFLFFFTQLLHAQQAPADKWIGNFANREKGIVLSVTPKVEGMFGGEFRYEQQKFPIRGIPVLGVFVGEYLHEETWFSFTLVQLGEKWLLTVDGVELQMDRLKAGEPLPLATARPAATATQPAQAPNAAGGVWQKRLNDRQLLFLNTEGGGSTKITLNLYANGSYSYQSSSSYSSGGYADFSYADQNADNGKWTVVAKGNGAALQLSSSKSGHKTDYALQSGASDGQVLLNGRKYFLREIQ